MNQNEYASPRSTQFSLGIQQAIGKRCCPCPMLAARTAIRTITRRPTWCRKSLLPGMITNSALAQTYNANVPYLGYNSVKMAQNEANGDYNSVQLSFRGSYAEERPDLSGRIHLFAHERLVQQLGKRWRSVSSFQSLRGMEV